MASESAPGATPRTWERRGEESGGQVMHTKMRSGGRSVLHVSACLGGKTPNFVFLDLLGEMEIEKRVTKPRARALEGHHIIPQWLLRENLRHRGPPQGYPRRAG